MTKIQRALPVWGRDDILHELIEGLRARSTAEEIATWINTTLGRSLDLELTGNSVIGALNRDVVLDLVKERIPDEFEDLLNAFRQGAQKGWDRRLDRTTTRTPKEKRQRTQQVVSKETRWKRAKTQLTALKSRTVFFTCHCGRRTTKPFCAEHLQAGLHRIAQLLHAIRT